MAVIIELCSPGTVCVFTLLCCLLIAAGFDQVFPMEKLFLFSATELQMILCGDQSPQWTKDDIVNYTEPKLGYTRERFVDIRFVTRFSEAFCS